MVISKRVGPSRSDQLLLALVITAALNATAGTGMAADLPKEGSFTTTYIAMYNEQEVETLPKRYAGSFDAHVVHLNDAGSGFLHRMSGRCIGAGGNINDEGGTKNVGQCILTDSDGDRVNVQIENGRERRGVTTTGTGTIVGGTGKYAGIQGRYDYGLDPLKAVDKSLNTAIGHTKGSYKIVSPAQ